MPDVARSVEWINRSAAIDGSVIRSRLFPARTVLDIGSGIKPQSFLLPDVHICVEPYEPYIETLRENLAPDRDWVFLRTTWEEMLPKFPDGSVDVVFALDVIEHLTKEDGERLLTEAQRVSRHQVVIFTPIGFYPQSYMADEPDRWGMHGGEWQTHRSGWSPDEFSAEWDVVACADLHDVDEHGRRLDRPFGAFWAIHGTRPAHAAPAPAVAEPIGSDGTPEVVSANPKRAAPAPRPRVLFVAMANSPHAARWVAQLEESDFDAYVFPTEVPTVIPITPLLAELAPSAQVVEGWPLPFGGRNLALRAARPFKPGWPIRAWQLARVIRQIKPDVIHSLEIQHAGYLMLSARLIVGDASPPWMVSNWGSDTYIFGQLDEHRERIQSVLEFCDYYTAECGRDITAARDLGFVGSTLPVLPAAGGVDVRGLQRYRAPGEASARRVIAMRGYQGWAGRALVGLRAIERAADALGGYRIAVYNWTSSPDVPLAVDLVAKRTGLQFDLMPYGPHEDIWRLHGRSRALIALSIGDGISTSMLEAITMGSFPIQSDTSCASEWLEDGVTGMLVHPEDPEAVEAAIRRVVADDALVDHAAEANAAVVRTRLDHRAVRPQAIAMYERVLRERGPGNAASRR